MVKQNKTDINRVTKYFESQGPDLRVDFVQKVYFETVLGIQHDIWDVHSNDGRWWVISEPMNLYSQEQFPNMDLALTFYIGLCTRIPRSEQANLTDLPAEPFIQCCRCIEEASEALGMLKK